MYSGLEEDYDKVYRYCYMKLKHQQTAEDITQETFLCFLEDCTYKEMGRRLPFLYTIARNKCIDHCRMKKKMVWITLLILCAGVVFTILSPFWSLGFSTDEGERFTYGEMQEKDHKSAEYFNGRKIDNNMLEELDDADQSGSLDIPNDLSAFFSSMGSYGAIDYTQERPFGFREDIYELRDRVLENRWEAEYLSEGEIRELRDKNESLTTPFTFQYAAGYKNTINLSDIMAVMQALFIAVCIPLIFSEEHHRKTAQISMCTRYGKNILFGAKIFTGITFSVLAVIIMFICGIIPAFLVYGAEGIGTKIQVYYPLFSWDLTLGQMLLILLGLWIAAAVLQSVIAMLIAEKSRSSTIPMAIIIGILLFTSFFHMPAQQKILSQIWAYVPVNMSRLQDAFGDMMISVFGKYYGVWQSAPVFYILLSAIVIFAACRIYRGFQVKEK